MSFFRLLHALLELRVLFLLNLSILRPSGLLAAKEFFLLLGLLCIFPILVVPVSFDDSFLTLPLLCEHLLQLFFLIFHIRLLLVKNHLPAALRLFEPLLDLVHVGGHVARIVSSIV